MPNRGLKGLMERSFHKVEVPSLPNEIIIRIIREAEEGYGGSHWRKHRDKFNKCVIVKGRTINRLQRDWGLNPDVIYNISLNRQISCWNCYNCNMINHTSDDECFKCWNKNELVYCTYPKPPRNSAGYISDYDSDYDEFYEYQVDGAWVPPPS